jgi:hypothetical protein
MSRLIDDSLLYGKSRWLSRRSTPPESWRKVQSGDVRRLESQYAVTALLEHGFTADQISTRRRRSK